jgi:hypothetical protein
MSNKNDTNTNNNNNNTTWQQVLAQVIQLHQDPEELHKIISELTAFKERIDQKIRSCSAKIADLVSLVDSNQSADQDVSYNMQQRVVDATFSIGPNKHKFSITFNHTDTEGDKELQVSCELFEYQENKFYPPEEKDLIKFFQDTGIKMHTAKAAKYSTEPTAATRKAILVEIFDQCIQLLNAKYGVEDDYGMDLGWTSEDLAEHLQTEKSKKRKKQQS